MSDETRRRNMDEERSNRIPEKTLARMRWYLDALDRFADEGVTVVASHEIAERVRVKSGLVRKDLSQFGGFGRPSVGYSVAYLRKTINDILQANHTRKIAWVGAERLDGDPMLLRKLAGSSCEIAAVFDLNPLKIDSEVGEHKVLAEDLIGSTLMEYGIDTAVIATSGDQAQRAADELVNGGVKAILNLTPALISVPNGITVRHIDIVSELLLLSYSSG